MRLTTAYAGISGSLRQTPCVRLLTPEIHSVGGDGSAGGPRLFEIDAADLVDLPEADIAECFGPASVLVRYDFDQWASVIAALPASLAGTVHATPEEPELCAQVAAALRPRVARLLFDAWPTGVLVSWAQHHGGPWPATNTVHTSVGTSAISRWLRPFCWQNAPGALLPDELRDETQATPRRIDGTLVS